MTIALIAAMDRNRLIGKAGAKFGLPWDLPDDRKHYKTHTIGKPIIEGRKTYEETRRLLPGRTTIILTSDPDYVVPGALVVHSVDEAIRVGTEEARRLGVDEIMISGGGKVFGEFLPRAQRLYLTEVDGEFEGDAYFPEFSHTEWREVSRTHHAADERHSHAFDYVVYERA